MADFWASLGSTVHQVLSLYHWALAPTINYNADSLKRLQLSEATVITFMTPLVASFGGYLLLGSPFSWLEILLSIISLFGVLLVASADGLFPAARTDVATNDLEAFDFTSRIWAICAGLVGVCGSAAAFLCMSFIGKTEGPLTVVNYFAALCALVSFIMLVALPGLSLQAPGGVRQWGLLFFSGLSGFLMVGLTQPAKVDTMY